MKDATVSIPDQTTMRIASINLFFGNRRHRRALEFIRSVQSDVVVLVEATARWRRALEALAMDYPHSHSANGTRLQGVLVLSRWPIVDADIVLFDDRAEPALAATLCVRGQTLRLIAVHATWPMGLSNFRSRNRQLAHLAQIARKAASPLVMIGDFNTTASSPHFQSLLTGSGLRRASAGFGPQPTWPAFLLPIGIQIDHCLVSAEIHVRSFSRGTSIGSDHRPIVVDLDLSGHSLHTAAHSQSRSRE